MRKISAQKLLILLGGFMISLAVVRCTKDGATAKQLNRAFNGTHDSAVFSPFYDTTKVSTADLTPDVNDLISVRGVKTIIGTYCVSANCHGGKFEPSLTSYAEIKNLVVPGNPEASKLWNLITTNDLNRAMPPVNIVNELSETDKGIIYNWIKNGAKETPDIADFRPAAVKLIGLGCSAVNCHNESTTVGYWARKGLLNITAGDTISFAYTSPSTGSVTYYPVATNLTLNNNIWNAYKDSVKKFYADTLANISFRPYKTFSTPISSASHRGPLNTYDDIVMDINYPKGIRSNSSPAFYDGSGNKIYVKGDYLNSTGFLYRIDSTLLGATVRTGVYSTSKNGGMAYSDGGLTPSDVALIKAWYFADPNILSAWKYGLNNAGIYKYYKSGTIIKQ